MTQNNKKATGTQPPATTTTALPTGNIQVYNWFKRLVVILINQGLRYDCSTIFEQPCLIFPDEPQRLESNDNRKWIYFKNSGQLHT